MPGINLKNVKLPDAEKCKFNLLDFRPFQAGLHEAASMLGWGRSLFRSKCLTPDEIEDEVSAAEAQGSLPSSASVMTPA